MITVKWSGTFVSDRVRRPHTSKLTFTGDTLEDIHVLINEFVESMEDDTIFDWELKSSRILSTQKVVKKVSFPAKRKILVPA